MKRYRIDILTLALTFTASAIGLAQSHSAWPDSGVVQPKLRQELLQLSDVDQKIRQEWIKSMSSHTADSTLAATMDSIDRTSTDRIKAIVRQYGWPGRHLVGEDGSQSAFLLIQHSRDTLFQRNCLPLLEAAFKAGEASGEALALLTDRVRVREGKPQLYGSQAQIIGGKLVVNPIEDERNVDARRAKLGLPPMAEYIKMLEEMYHLKVK